MYAGDIRECYFEWLCDIVCRDRFSEEVSFESLLRHLHDVEFTWTRHLDSDRADWGVNMRYRFARWYGDYFDIRDHVKGPCSMLEMMVALAVRCEEDLMTDPDYGDRTPQWFWSMIVSLGLGSMTEYNYDAEYVSNVIQRFLNHEYEPNGRGSLFTLRYPPFDSRKVDIWHQMCWYLDELSGDIPAVSRIRKE